MMIIDQNTGAKKPAKQEARRKTGEASVKEEELAKEEDKEDAV